MTNFELIDDYLTNRLTENEKVAFEQQVASDPSLKADVELQKNILEGIKRARVAELKAMLNNVPVGTSVSVSFSAMKIAAGIIGGGLLIGSIYYYFQPEGLKDVPKLSTSIQDSVQGNDSVENAEKIIPIEEPTKENSEPATVVEPKKEKAPTSTRDESKPAEVKQPKIEVTDPTDELSSEDNQSAVEAHDNKSAITRSTIQVDIDASNRKYNFHYQFVDGKLQLFGPFDKSLYEILEINGDHHNVFLFYRENYYLLDEKEDEITKLVLIKDSTLLKKLKEYRGQ